MIQRKCNIQCLHPDIEVYVKAHAGQYVQLVPTTLIKCRTVAVYDIPMEREHEVLIACPAQDSIWKRYVCVSEPYDAYEPFGSTRVHDEEATYSDGKVFFVISMSDSEVPCKSLTVNIGQDCDHPIQVISGGAFRFLRSFTIPTFQNMHSLLTEHQSA